jgi:hypothetical protein
MQKLDLSTLSFQQLDIVNTIAKSKIQKAAWQRGMIEDLVLNGPQKEMIEFVDTQPGPLYFLLCSRRIGKSTVLATLGVRECIRRSHRRVLFLTDTAVHAQEILNDILDHVFATCPDELRPTPRVKENKLVFGNGSTFTAKGVEGLAATALRGLKGDVVIIDEACFIANIQYVVYSVLMPMVIGQKGKLICGSTPPDSPGHDSVEIIQHCESEGTLLVKTIYDQKGLLYDDKQINEFAKQAGGEHTTRFRREYLAEVVAEDDASICPLATKEKMEIIVQPAPKIEGYTPDYYVGLDLGMRDKTVAIYGYWDYERAKLIVQKECVFEDKKATTENMALEFKKIESELWGTVEPYKRFCDLDLRFVEDIKQLHGIRFTASPKDNKEAAVNALNIMIQNEQLTIDPSCKHLIAQIKYGTWKENRREFSRSKKLGHCDALDALIFIVRNLKRNRNPIPGTLFDSYIYGTNDPTLLDTRKIDGWASFGRHIGRK